MCIFAFMIMGTVREMCCTETDKVGEGKPKDGDNFKRGGKTAGEWPRVTITVVPLVLLSDCKVKSMLWPEQSKVAV